METAQNLSGPGRNLISPTNKAEIVGKPGGWVPGGTMALPRRAAGQVRSAEGLRFQIRMGRRSEITAAPSQNQRESKVMKRFISGVLVSQS